MNRIVPIVGPAKGPQGSRAVRSYWAFLSYAHADAAASDRLHKMLERFRVPQALRGQPHPLGTIPSRLTPVFRDRHELAAASNLSREIEEALEASKYLIVLCSPAAAKSRWVDQEIRAFRRLHGNERILAAILDGEPFAADAEQECFPPSLRRKGSEPIAADLRVEGDGWRGGFLKLAAGMLDVGLDDLVHREQHRRQKRLAWMAAASIAGMAVTSGLAIFALDARDAARDERREAEGLVEFMLGDLKGKLEPIGKLDALDGVGARILAYYSKQDAAELDDAGLMQRSRALSLTAQVAFQRADLATAERLYQQALTGTAEAIRRDPSDAERLFDHAQNVFWVGELARHRGQIGKAEAATFEYQRLANRMVAIEPANLRYRIETVYATENVAIVLLNRRQFGEARRLIEAALGTINAMATANPDNEEYQRELGTILAWLADANRDDGRLAEATAARRRQIDLLSGKLASGEPNVRFQEQLLWGRRALGILLVMQGEMQRAITELKLAVQQADQLIQVEPDNGQWRGHAAGARLELATALIMLGRASEANRETTTGCELTSAIRERDPQGSWWLENQTNCRLNRARLAMMDGALEDSLALAASAVDSARIERGTDAAKTRYRIAGAYRLVGDIHQRSGNREAARAAWAEGLQQLPTNVRERPREMAERAGLLDRLGRDKEARPLVRKLKDIGFKAQY